MKSDSTVELLEEESAPIEKVYAYKIRPLVRRDRVFLSKMVEKVALKAGNSDLLELISTAATAEGKEEANSKSRAKLGIELMKLLLQVVNEDLTEWFASLCGVSGEEFDNLPFGIELDIVQQLVIADEVTDFFTGASQQFSGILASASRSKGKKTK